MGIYIIHCPNCQAPHSWFSGNKDQRCWTCISKQKEADKTIDEFMQNESDLVDSLSRQEEKDKLVFRLSELKTTHNLIGRLIKELEYEIEKE